MTGAGSRAARACLLLAFAALQTTPAVADGASRAEWQLRMFADLCLAHPGDTDAVRRAGRKNGFLAFPAFLSRFTDGGDWDIELEMLAPGATPALDVEVATVQVWRTVWRDCSVVSHAMHVDETRTLLEPFLVRRSPAEIRVDGTATEHRWRENQYAEGSYLHLGWDREAPSTWLTLSVPIETDAEPRR